MKAQSMRSWNLNASNLEESVRFYRDLLGAEVRQESQVEGVDVTRLRLGDFGIGLFDASGGERPGVPHHTVSIDGPDDPEQLKGELEGKGIKVDVRGLARDLGVPAVPTVARTKQGLDQLVSTVAEVISGAVVSRPHRPEPPAELQEAVNQLVPMIEELAPGLPNARWLAFRLLDGDHRVRQALLSGELRELEAKQTQAIEKTSRVMAQRSRYCRG